MKKAVFYSYMRVDGKNKAVQHTGWTDGQYNYFRRENGCWYAIEPQTGLAVCNSYRRSEAQERATAPHTAKAVKDRITPEMVERFTAAVNAAKTI